MTRTHAVGATLAFLIVVAAVVALTVEPGPHDAPRANPPATSPHSGVSPGIVRLLEEIRDADTGHLAISPEDGLFLRTIVAASRTTKALEIGGASGYSAIWIGLGLRETGGRLITIEYDPARARALAQNIGRAGLTDVVQVVAGDAFARVPTLPGTFDFVFLDAWKKDYKRFLDLVLPRLGPGGLFLAHNVVNKRDEMGDFLDAIQRNPLLFTAIVSPSGEGISVSYRRAKE